MNRKNLRGFFFVLIAFVLLSYILFSTNMWVRAIETSERTYSDAFRASSMAMIADQVSQGRMDRYADMSTHYALYRLSNYSIGHPLRAGEGTKELDHIKSAYAELLFNCSTSPEHFAGGTALSYNEGDESTYCFSGFLSLLNESLSKNGFEVEHFSVYDFSFNETGHPLRFSVNFSMDLRLKDLESQTSLVRTYRFDRVVDAEGMVDPLLARESMGLRGTGAKENLTVYKGIYLYPYPEEDAGDGEEEEVTYEDYANAHEQLYPEIIGHGFQGQGWFYGPVVLAEDADDVSANQTLHYILAGNYSEILAVENYRDFGAYVLLNEPDEEAGDCDDNEYSTFNALDYGDRDSGGHCPGHPVIRDGTETDKPFMVYRDFMDDVYGKAGVRRDYHLGEGSYDAVQILFVSRYSVSEVQDKPERKQEEAFVYDMENFRDYVRCSYYIVHADEAPSFLQRMLEGGYELTSPLGIETTLVGKYAGGVYNMDLYDSYSRVDREFFNSVDGEKVRGMPGCKDQPMCVDEHSEVGHFALSWESMKFYFNVEDEKDDENIGCNDGKASCEVR